jgi:hypothetical protein
MKHRLTHDGILKGRVKIGEDGILRAVEPHEPQSGSVCPRCAGPMTKRRDHVTMGGGLVDYCRLCGPRYPASVA